jgi:hypothetical protein
MFPPNIKNPVATYTVFWNVSDVPLHGATTANTSTLSTEFNSHFHRDVHHYNTSLQRLYRRTSRLARDPNPANAV